MKNNHSSYIVTCDIDWAPDWMLEKVFDILSDFKVTYFLTNDTPVQRELSKNIDFAGYHPNLQKNSDHGDNIIEAFNYFDSFLPKLYMNRFHLFGFSERDLKFLSDRKIKLDTSSIYPNHANISKIFREDLNMTFLPNFWMDGVWYFNKKLPKQNLKGLKCLVVHPIDLYFNFKTNEEREKIKNLLPSVSLLTEEISKKFINYDGNGSRDAFLELLSKSTNDIIPLHSILEV